MLQRKCSRLRLVSVCAIALLIGACANQTARKSAPVPEPKKVEIPVFTEAQKTAFNQALSLLREGNLDSAEQAFLSLVKQSPRMAGALANLGIISELRGDASKARDYFEKTLSANPANAEALVHLALYEMEAGQFDLAERQLLQVVASAPENALAHYNLGVLYELYLQRYDEAQGHYQRYTELHKSEDTAIVERWIKLLERK